MSVCLDSGISSVLLDKLLNSSVLPFPNLPNGNNSVVGSTCQGLKEMTFIKHLTKPDPRYTIIIILPKTNPILRSLYCLAQVSTRWLNPLRVYSCEPLLPYLSGD